MSTRATQQQRILELLLQGFRQHREIPLPEILALRISQFGTRIKELRAAGWQIVNRQEAIEGRRHSWYSLKSSIRSTEPEPQTPRRTPSTCVQANEKPRPGWRSQGFNYGTKNPEQSGFSFRNFQNWETGRER